MTDQSEEELRQVTNVELHRIISDHLIASSKALDQAQKDLLKASQSTQRAIEVLVRLQILYERLSEEIQSN